MMAREADARLARNLEKLNKIISEELAYFSFGFSECGYKSQCFGRKSVHGEYENWHAYTSSGRASLVDSAGGATLDSLGISKGVDVRRINFYNPDSRAGKKFDSVFLALALCGKHVKKGHWHLFYNVMEKGGSVFDWEMTREERVDYVELSSSLLVLPGRKNIQRIFEVRKEIMEKEPEFIETEEWHQESERDRAYRYKKRERNPKKTNPSALDILEKFGFPPFVKRLAASCCPEIPIESEMEESVRIIAEASQLKLPLEQLSF